MLDRAKRACRIDADETAFDDELRDLIEEGKDDLRIVGVLPPPPGAVRVTYDRAVIAFVKVHFGHPEDYDRMSAAYDLLKAQLMSSSDYGQFRGGDEP